MSRAEITRSNLPLLRRVKVMCSMRASSLLPIAQNLDSIWLCLTSDTTTNGWLKKTCSASAIETPCLSFLRALPVSQSKPVTCAKSII